MDPMTMAAVANAGANIYSSLFGGSKDKVSQKPTMLPQQKKSLLDFLGLFNQMQSGGGFQNAMGGLQDFMNPESEAYQNFEQPYLNEFNQRTVPGLAEQFAGMGAMGGGLSSSGFGQALGAAGSNLQTNLAQMKTGLRRNAIQDFLSQFNQMAQTGFGQSPFGYMTKQGQQAPEMNPQSISTLMNAMFNKGGAQQNYQAKFPLTNTYDQMFRTGSAY